MCCMEKSKPFNSVLYFIVLVCVVLILGLGYAYLRTILGRFSVLAIFIPALLIKAFSNYLIANNLMRQRYWVVLLITPLLGVFYMDGYFMNTLGWYSNRASALLYVWFLITHFYSRYKLKGLIKVVIPVLIGLCHLQI